MKKIGVYGGSFDPIHLGHLNLAVEMLEAHQLDEVWFCPTSLNPHKCQGSTARVTERLQMVLLAIEKNPAFKVIANEIYREGPCYTIDTMRQLASAQAENGTAQQFFLILGDDAARAFHRWRQPEEIIAYAKLLVGRRRKETTTQPLEGSPLVIAALHKGLTPMRIFEISSTEIRARLSKRLYCAHLLPGKVLDYILAHDLYLNQESKTLTPKELL